ncbi:hypothetical protein JCM18750_40560 [Halostagnicola bangensis]
MKEKKEPRSHRKTSAKGQDDSTYPPVTDRNTIEIGCSTPLTENDALLDRIFGTDDVQVLE